MTKSEEQKIWVGADPGGQRKFGLTLLSSEGIAISRSCDCAGDAIQFVQDQGLGEPPGIGVDAPLWWSSGRSGDRLVDQWLRKTYGLSGGQVQAMNSLRGAALVQGMMFVSEMRTLFPAVKVTETHPKALLKAIKLDWDGFCRRYSICAEPKSDDECDAIVSAVAAREGFEGRWTHDLSLERYPFEQDPKKFWLGPVHYFWPE